jgi:hypothetical protein
MVEATERQSSLLRCRINNGRKKFYVTGTWGLTLIPQEIMFVTLTPCYLTESQLVGCHLSDAVMVTFCHFAQTVILLSVEKMGAYLGNQWN